MHKNAGRDLENLETKTMNSKWVKGTWNVKG